MKEYIPLNDLANQVANDKSCSSYSNKKVDEFLKNRKKNIKKDNQKKRGFK